MVAQEDRLRPDVAAAPDWVCAGFELMPRGTLSRFGFGTAEKEPQNSDMEHAANTNNAVGRETDAA